MGIRQTVAPIMMRKGVVVALLDPQTVSFSMPPTVPEKIPLFAGCECEKAVCCRLRLRFRRASK